MVGPKKQDFWPKINILKGKKNLFMNDFSNKLEGPKIDDRKNAFIKKWSPKLIFLYEKVNLKIPLIFQKYDFGTF